MLINLSNHPSANWSAEQTEAAIRQFGEIVDLPFPDVAPDGDEDYITTLATEYCSKVLEYAQTQPFTVHLMGEMTLTFALLQRLQAHSIPCVASTTRRIITEYSDGRKESVFQFVRFRKYTLL